MRRSAPALDLAGVFSLAQCAAKAKSTKRQCGRSALAGATVCSVHGGSAPQVKAAAARRVVLAKAEAEVARIGRVVPGQSPLDALDEALADCIAVKDRLRAIVARLNDEELRYRSRAGEQLRAEVAAFMTSIRDVVRTSETILKLGIAERRANIAEQEARAIVAVVAAVLDRLGLSSEQRALSRVVVPEELRAASDRFSAEQANRPMLPAGSKRTA